MRFLFPPAVALLIVTAALLAGCVLGPDRPEIDRQAAETQAGCETHYEAGIIRTALGEIGAFAMMAVESDRNRFIRT